MVSYELPMDNLVCLVGENCTTNVTTANVLKRPLLGCRSHRFNLAIESYMANHLAAETEMIATLMQSLLTLKKGTSRREQTHARTVKRNQARWLDLRIMVQRLERLLPHLDELQNAAVSELIPATAQQRKLDEYKSTMQIFKSIALMLQERSTTLLHSHMLFQRILSDFPNEPSFPKYLSLEGDIVTFPHFERALVKIQNNNEIDLTAEERVTVAALLKNPFEPARNVPTANAGRNYAQLYHSRLHPARHNRV